jgi:hypothetical protein
MFDMLEADPAPIPVPGDSDPDPVPLDRLEAEICELAGHLAAATCRFLVRLGDFDARRGWASWEMASCAAWLSWKCQMSSGTAREHVRVARALRDLPVIRGEFAAGRLSYAKVRALTRTAPGDPADPARCHVEDGPAISVSTAQMIACSATLSWMLHDSAGQLLDLGRRRRRPNAALRRAARERDTCRCRFPGCESRRVDLHHIQYWSDGGRTKLDNLVSLCKYHHTLVHDRGYLIAAARDGTFAFYRPDGTAIPAWYGERLDLDHAIYICLANARTQEERQAGRDQAGEPGTRDRVTVYAAEDWGDRIRQYYAEHAA